MITIIVKENERKIYKNICRIEKNSSHVKLHFYISFKMFSFTKNISYKLILHTFCIEIII